MTSPTEPRRVLVTGATGFLNRNVLAALRTSDGVEPIAACRTPSRLDGQFSGEIRAGDLRDADYRRTVVRHRGDRHSHREWRPGRRLLDHPGDRLLAPPYESRLRS